MLHKSNIPDTDISIANKFILMLMVTVFKMRVKTVLRLMMLCTIKH